MMYETYENIFICERPDHSATHLFSCPSSPAPTLHLEMSGRLGVEAGVGSKDDAICFRGIGFAAAKLRSPYRSSSFMVSFMAMVGLQELERGPESERFSDLLDGKLRKLQENLKVSPKKFSTFIRFIDVTPCLIYVRGNQQLIAREAGCHVDEIE
eukprot:scaffold9211_cov183-Skeletonema_dohrnii-CCMP3373.AAC.7